MILIDYLKPFSIALAAVSLVLNTCTCTCMYIYMYFAHKTFLCNFIALIAKILEINNYYFYSTKLGVHFLLHVQVTWSSVYRSISREPFLLVSRWWTCRCTRNFVCMCAALWHYYQLDTLIN